MLNQSVAVPCVYLHNSHYSAKRQHTCRLTSISSWSSSSDQITSSQNNVLVLAHTTLWWQKFHCCLSLCMEQSSLRA